LVDETRPSKKRRRLGEGIMSTARVPKGANDGEESKAVATPQAKPKKKTKKRLHQEGTKEAPRATTTTDGGMISAAEGHQVDLIPPAAAQRPPKTKKRGRLDGGSTPGAVEPRATEERRAIAAGLDTGGEARAVHPQASVLPKTPSGKPQSQRNSSGVETEGGTAPPASKKRRRKQQPMPAPEGTVADDDEDEIDLSDIVFTEEPPRPAAAPSLPPTPKRSDHSTVNPAPKAPYKPNAAAPASKWSYSSRAPSRDPSDTQSHRKERNLRTVFMGGCPPGTTDQHIWNLFRSLGADAVEGIKHVLTWDGKPKGCAFVTFASVDGAQSALKLPQPRILGTAVKLAPVLDSSEDKDTRTVRLDECPEFITEFNLRNHFQRFGMVERVQIVINKLGLHSGIVFIRFRAPREAAQAAKAGTVTVGGHAIPIRCVR